MEIRLDQIQKVKNDWKQAVLNQDLEGLMKLYATNAVLKPTLSVAIRRTPDEIKSYFVGGEVFGDSGFLHKNFKEVTFKDAFPLFSGNLAVETGEYDFVDQNGGVTSAHYTFCFSLDKDGEARILTQHSSLK